MENVPRTTHRLGSRAFMLFLRQHTQLYVLAAVLLGAAWWAQRWLPEQYRLYSGYGLKVLLLAAAAAIVFKAFKAFFEYRGYAYRFEEEFFHITRGYIRRDEIGVVYHQIQTVTLHHGIVDRFLGVSYLTIVMNGNQSRPSEVVLPALETSKARWVRQELLRQARLRSAYSPAPAVNEAEVWR